MFEVIRKDVTKNKLTIAKDRTSIKITLATPEEKVERIVAFAKSIESKVREKYLFTMRGEIQFIEEAQRYSIYLRSENRKFTEHYIE